MVQVATWINLNGTAGQVMLPVLRILTSPDETHRYCLTHTAYFARLTWLS